MTTVSIVVPIYDVAPYLHTCVSSILNQSHQDLEVILVDDGSRDGSRNICEEFAARDSRVVVVHRPNGGLSVARNSGLRVATGEYVMFLDGDDWIDCDGVRNLVEAAGAEADLVVAGYWVDFEDSQGSLVAREIRCPMPREVVSGRASPAILGDGGLPVQIGYAWNKLYKRRLLIDNGLMFEEDLDVVEDVIFNESVFLVASRVIFLRTATIHYVQRPRHSLGTKWRPDLLELRLRAMDAVGGILTRCGAEDRVVQEVRSSMALVALKGMVLTRKSGGTLDAWYGTRDFMGQPSYSTLVLSLPSGKNLSKVDKVFVLLLKSGLAPVMAVGYNFVNRFRAWRRTGTLTAFGAPPPQPLSPPESGAIP